MKKKTIFTLALAFALTGAAMVITFKTMNDNVKERELSAGTCVDPCG